MKLTVRPELKLALALIFILAVYFQSISHPFNFIDDPNIVDYYGINSTLSILDVITPGNGIYYRPLVDLSYWLDYQLWGMDSTFMHLENIVVHLANVILVFLIASRLPVSSEFNKLPIFCALIFGLHPINSEPVNWIAGRTDLFAGMCVFFAVYCLVRAIQEQSTRFAIIAFGVFLVGTLVKETAIMFIPVAFLVIFYWPVTPHNVAQYRSWKMRSLIIPILVSTCLVSLLLIVLYIKGHGNNAITLIFENSSNPLLRSLEALGFYIKKLFLPLPLNMAIVEVDHLYAIVGIITLCVVVVTFRRIGIPAIFFASAGLFILPALIVATSTFAWTPFGERYLYIPSAFAVLGCLELFHRFLVRWKVVKLFVPTVSIILSIASVATIQRGMLWGDNLALIEDIVEKSPSFGVARNQYGGLLLLDGRYDEAEKQFKIGLQQKNKESTNRIIRLNLIWLKIQGKDKAEARRILLSEIGDKVNGDLELLKRINKLNEKILLEAVTLENRKIIVADIIEINENLYLNTREPFYIYRSGQLALSIGDKQNAAVFFRRAYEYALPNAYYREPARILADKLSAE